MDMRFLKEEANLVQLTKLILIVGAGLVLIRITIQLDKIIGLL